MKRLLLTISLIAGAIAAYTSCEEQEQAPEIVKVESVSIDQEDMTLTEGESVTLTATVLPEDAADKTVAWSSSDESVVMVSSSGKVMAMSLGKAAVTAKAGDKSDFISVTVVAKTIPVTGISLNPSEITMKVGESQVITAEVTPQDATDKSVTWESSNPEVASVNNGTVVGVNPGSVTITATTVNGGKTAECSVTIKANLAPSVTVGADHISAVSAVLSGEANLESSMAADMTMGIMYSLNSAVLPSNSTKISTNDISLKQGFESSYCYSVNVLGLTPNTTYYYRSYVNQSGQDTYGETKEFTTKDVASLLETKEASGVEATKATLNAKLDLTDVLYKSLAYGFLWGTSESALNTDFKCTEIKDNAIAAALTSLSHKTQYWYKAYVKLDSQTFYGEVKTFTTDVVPVESVSVDKTENTFHTIGSTLTLNATVLPSDATDKSVEWSSDKEDVATVTTSGVVTAKGNGTATITVKTKDQEKTATCAITVAQWVTSVTLNNPSLTLNEGQEQTLIPTVNPSNAANKSLNWTSSDTSVATVNAEGKVTAISKGTATIKAEAKDGSGVNATCSVVVSSKCPAGAVDMGTTTADGYKLYWGISNLGAGKPEEYGDYYAWGEIDPYYSSQDPLAWKDGKTGYNWASYKWCNGSFRTLTKYNTSSSYGTVDNKTVLESSDDVASVKLGGKWRMPTDAEWTELMAKCTWTWTSDYNGTGVKGRIVTATNGNSIFLPAAGYRFDTGLVDAGSFGYFWSSSLDTGYPYDARPVNFDSDFVARGGYYRYVGQSVRPVTE